MKNVLKVMETSEARAYTLHLPSSIYLGKKEQRSRILDSSGERFMNPEQSNNTMVHRVISLHIKILCQCRRKNFFHI